MAEWLSPHNTELHKKFYCRRLSVLVQSAVPSALCSTLANRLLSFWRVVESSHGYEIGFSSDS